MRKKLAGTFVALLILATVLAAANHMIPRGHAATVGVVCLAGQGFFIPGPPVEACPTPPVIFTPSDVSVNNQLRIAVDINGSDVFLGFDITLKADHTILKPADANLTGSVLTGASVTDKCIGNVTKIGPCAPTDNSDTIHFAASQSNTITTSGLLFTAVFNVTGTKTSGTRIGFQTGCPTPTSTPPNVCIIMTNGSLTPTSETDQESSFSNQPGFAISANPTGLSLKTGASIPSTITVTSVLNFKGIVSLSTTVSPVGLGATLTDQSLNATTNPSTTLTISAPTSAMPILYSVNVTGTASSATLFTVISVNVVNFAISASPASLTISVAKNDNSTITLTGQNGYVGTLTLTTAVNATTGLTVTCNPTSITLDPSRPSLPNTSKCTFKPSTAGGYNVTITASDGTITHSRFVIIKALQSGAADYAINTLPSTVNVPVGGSNQTVLVVTSISGFSGTVNLTATTTANGFTVSPSTFSLQLSPSGANFTTITITAATSAFSGTYSVSIAGSGQGITHTTLLTVVAIATFSISPSSQSLTVSSGFSAKANMTLTNLGNLAGAVTLTAQSSPTGLTESFGTTTVTLTGAAQKSTILTINAPNGTSPGIYTVTVTGKIGSLTNSATLTINVVLHDLTIVTVVVNTSTAAQGAIVTYSIVVQNKGTVSDNATVDALVGDLTVNATNLILQPGEAKVVTLTWDTTKFTPGPYSLGAKVLTVPGESNTANNIDMATSSLSLTAPLTNPLPQSSLLVLVIVVAIVAAILGIVLFRRRTQAGTDQ